MGYELKLAKIIDSRIYKKNLYIDLFRVRVLPDMSDIPEDQENLLPVYPNFFRGDNKAYQKDDIVWVVCSEDFQIGFILGIAQPPKGEGMLGFFTLINTAETEAGEPFVASGTNDITVKAISGSFILYSNDRRGQSGQIYNNKTVVLFAGDGTIWVKNPGMTFRASKSGHISIKGKTLVQDFSNIETTAINNKLKATAMTIDTDGAYNLEVGSAYSLTANKKSETIEANDDSVVLGKSTEIITGGKKTTVANGGISSTVVLGDYNIEVAAGKVSITTGGGIDLISALPINLISPMLNVKAPITNLPANPLSGFCTLPVCLLTGVLHVSPTHTGVPTP